MSTSTLLACAIIQPLLYRATIQTSSWSAVIQPRKHCSAFALSSPTTIPCHLLYKSDQYVRVTSSRGVVASVYRSTQLTRVIGRLIDRLRKAAAEEQRRERELGSREARNALRLTFRLLDVVPTHSRSLSLALSGCCSLASSRHRPSSPAAHTRLCATVSAHCCIHNDWLSLSLSLSLSLVDELGRERYRQLLHYTSIARSLAAHVCSTMSKKSSTKKMLASIRQPAKVSKPTFDRNSPTCPPIINEVCTYLEEVGTCGSCATQLSTIVSILPPACVSVRPSVHLPACLPACLSVCHLRGPLAYTLEL